MIGFVVILLICCAKAQKNVLLPADDMQWFQLNSIDSLCPQSSTMWAAKLSCCYKLDSYFARFILTSSPKEGKVVIEWFSDSDCKVSQNIAIRSPMLYSDCLYASDKITSVLLKDPANRLYDTSQACSNDMNASLDYETTPAANLRGSLKHISCNAVSVMTTQGKVTGFSRRATMTNSDLNGKAKTKVAISRESTMIAIAVASIFGLVLMAFLYYYYFVLIPVTNDTLDAPLI